MFCPKCGATLADGTKFCGRCGNQLQAEQSAPADYAAPQPAVQPDYEPQTVESQPFQPQTFVQPQPTQQAVPVNKFRFLAKHATGGVKAMSWVSWIACLLCIALVAVSVYTVMTAPILELPVVELAASAVPEMEDSIDELKDELDQGADQIKQSKEHYKMVAEGLTDDQQEAADEFFDLVDGWDSDFSLSDMNRAIKAILLASENELQDALSLGDVEEVESVSDSLNAVYLTAIIMLSVLSLLVLLAALFKLNTLTVISMVFLLPIIFLLGGVLPTVGAFVLFVVAIVAHLVININYKKYRKATLGIA